MNHVVDSSVWVEFLRGTDSAASRFVEERLARPEQPLAVTEPVLMEVLAGAPARGLDSVERLLGNQVLLGIEPRLDYHAAAEIHRRVRRSGQTVRSLNDCLIAAVALRHDAVVVHRDADFEAIAGVCPLRELSVSG